jgi:lipopolysaccharide export LptBFGC system permease protein LptF
MTVEQIENSLYELKNANPKKFVRIATDKNLELKAEIEEMVTAGVLRKIGNQIIFIDETLGDTTQDTVVFLKDKKNSGKLTLLRAKLKELSLV